MRKLNAALRVLTALTFMAPLVGCADSTPETEDPPSEPQESSVPVIVTAEWLNERLDDPELVVLQVARDAAAFEAGHIPGARFVAWREMTLDNDVGTEMPPAADLDRLFESVGVSDDTHVVFYGSGNPIWAARGFVTMDHLGHDRVSVLDGGWETWEAAGYATETGPGTPATGSFNPVVDEGVVVSADWIMENLGREDLALVDARPVDEYTGERGQLDDRAMKPGHIPGAHNVFYQELVETDGTGQYLPLSALAARYEAAGVDVGDTVVSYCMIGMRASVTYLVSRHLGYETVFYDGSWHDWSMRDLPAVPGSEPGAP
jgi:thiosulfate/3-mercaptopyruvate sulfurtransferase